MFPKFAFHRKNLGNFREKMEKFRGNEKRKKNLFTFSSEPKSVAETLEFDVTTASVKFAVVNPLLAAKVLAGFKVTFLLVVLMSSFCLLCFFSSFLL